jgi:ribosomal subunit interface protein
MQIQINTDNHIDGKEALAAHAESAVENALRHLKDRITRVEVHLSDENAGKSGSDDKRCLIEARPKNHQPVSVSHQAGSIHQAIDGAASKLKASLETVLGRLDDRQRHASIVPIDSE